MKTAHHETMMYFSYNVPHIPIQQAGNLPITEKPPRKYRTSRVPALAGRTFESFNAPSTASPSIYFSNTGIKIMITSNKDALIPSLLAMRTLLSIFNFVPRPINLIAFCFIASSHNDLIHLE